MRKVFLEDLPNHNRNVDWVSSVGHTVKFIYDDITGEIELLDYDKAKTQLTVSYNGKITKAYTRRLKAGEISVILGLMNFEFKFEIGDIVSGVEILNKIRKKRKSGDRVEKGYVVKCEKDGYVYEVFETDLASGKGCPVCAGRKVVIGVNDISTTRPDLIMYFKNKSDCYKYTAGSKKYIEVVCPDCGSVKNMNVCNLSMQGFSCKNCGDGVSYPNKFMNNLLTQLNLDFVTEYAPDWAIDNNSIQRIYDFYIPHKSLIIEMDGSFHYRDNKMSKQTVEELNYIDNVKDVMAHGNGMTIIRIDCNYEQAYRFDYICKSLKNSNISNFLDISKVDFNLCNMRATSNLVKEVCDLWMTRAFNSTRTLGEYMKISQCTAKVYLKQGAKLGWCDYNSKQEALKWAKLNGKKNGGNSVKIEVTEKICDVWNRDGGTSKDIGDKLGMSSNVVKYHLKKGAILGLCDYTLEKGRNAARVKANKTLKSKSKKVRVVNTGEIFNSALDLVSEYLDKYEMRLSRSKIYDICNKNRGNHKGLRFEYVN